MSEWQAPWRCLSPCCKRYDTAPLGECPATLRANRALRRGRDIEVRRWLIAVFLQIELPPAREENVRLDRTIKPTGDGAEGTRDPHFLQQVNPAVRTLPLGGICMDRADGQNVQRFGRRERAAAHLILANGFERFRDHLFRCGRRDVDGIKGKLDPLGLISDTDDEEDLILPRQPVEQAGERTQLAVEGLPAITDRQVDDLDAARVPGSLPDPFILRTAR